MTKAKALRNFYKKFYDVDAAGMTAVDVYRDFVKQKYDFDSKAYGPVSALNEMIDNDLAPSSGGGGDGDIIIVDALPSVEDADPNKKYLRALCPAFFKAPHSSFLLVSLTSNKLPDDAEILGTQTSGNYPCVVVDSSGNAKVYGYTYRPNDDGDPIGEFVEIPYPVTIATQGEYDPSSAEDFSLTCTNWCGYYIFKANKKAGQWNMIDISDTGK